MKLRHVDLMHTKNNKQYNNLYTLLIFLDVPSYINFSFYNIFNNTCGGKLMSSDINEIYRRVIYRNNTLIDLLTTSRSTPGELVMCLEKVVQEAVDTRLDNGIRGQPMRDGHNKVYKSFSDIIDGKEGRFRATLLGKRVDYSDR